MFWKDKMAFEQVPTTELNGNEFASNFFANKVIYGALDADTSSRWLILFLRKQGVVGQ
jgi:hypothetical protein